LESVEAARSSVREIPRNYAIAEPIAGTLTMPRLSEN